MSNKRKIKTYKKNEVINTNKKKRNNQNKGVIHYNNATPSVFKGGDMFHNRSFDNRGEELSGYVERTLIQIDQYGNKQIAKEKQFINSGRDMTIRINNERKKKY